MTETPTWVASLDNLIPEYAEWAAKNFGVGTPWRGVLGMLEELGELNEAQTVDDHAAIVDAIADLALFGLDWLGQHARLAASPFAVTAWQAIIPWTVARCWEAFIFHGQVDALPGAASRNLIIYLGRLAHHELKASQGIRGSAAFHEHVARAAFGGLLHELNRLARLYTARDHLGAVVAETWAEVRLRDWTKNKQDGGAS